MLRNALSPDGRPLVGYVGRLAPEKELDLLVSLARRDDLQLVVVGEGPDRARLQRLLPEATFLGLLRGADLAAAYASLDVFVHTGRHETYCQAAQEALASGVPAVAPRAGGPLDVIAEGVDGLFYEPGSAADLTAAVMSLVADPSWRHEMGASARRAVLGRSWESVNDRLLAHYRAVIDDDRMTIAA
jgi:phosphatidylinositol alpha 1,6-mannosyltransferase